MKPRENDSMPPELPLEPRGVEVSGDPRSERDLRAIKFGRALLNVPQPRVTAAVLIAGILAAALQCAAPESNRSSQSGAKGVTSDHEAGLAAWDVVYRVLQHPRCLNCHPAGDAPLQGEHSLPHLQNVTRGPDGHGLFGMRCETCHQETNLPGEHMPPGAPKWHLPPKDMPLVFEGKSSAELCRQIQDKKQNGGKSMDEIFHHMAHDALVLWGWAPGEGREPVSVPHDELVKALCTWIANGCGCP